MTAPSRSSDLALVVGGRLGFSCSSFRLFGSLRWFRRVSVPLGMMLPPLCLCFRRQIWQSLAASTTAASANRWFHNLPRGLFGVEFVHPDYAFIMCLERAVFSNCFTTFMRGLRRRCPKSAPAPYRAAPASIEGSACSIFAVVGIIIIKTIYIAHIAVTQHCWL